MMKSTMMRNMGDDHDDEEHGEDDHDDEHGHGEHGEDERILLRLSPIFGKSKAASMR